ncbi:MAG: RHS repeat-associated core domain-containing protein, partial [Campylobacterota bacterium]|nr:RHS repeat-associated core domain-containing protein [Campylobacterota bacterium]
MISKLPLNITNLMNDDSNNLTQTINYTYNKEFQVVSTNYADSATNYTYDNDGLLISSGEFTLIRDAINGFSTKITDDTLTQTKEYNNYGEVTKVSDNIFTYELSQRDESGAITQKIETINGDETTYDYTYDSRGRLTQVKLDNNIVEEYSYDDNSNRTEATVDGVTSKASYTDDDQIEKYGDKTYKYNDDGYLVELSKSSSSGGYGRETQEKTTYSYNTLGALTEVQTPDITITYQLNALNQRVAKEVDGEIVEKYLWANLTTLLAIYDKDDKLIQRFNYTDSRIPTSMTQDNKTYYLHYDQVGTLKAVSNQDKQIIKEITYDTFGNILKDTNEEFKVPFGFACGLHDKDTNLVHFGYREYDPFTGKWTAKDPIDFGGGDSNLYGYVLGNPVDFIDPTGEYAWILAGGVGGLIAGALAPFTTIGAIAVDTAWGMTTNALTAIDG